MSVNLFTTPLAASSSLSAQNQRERSSSCGSEEIEKTKQILEKTKNHLSSDSLTDWELLSSERDTRTETKADLNKGLRRRSMETASTEPTPEGITDDETAPLIKKTLKIQDDTRNIFQKICPCFPE